MKTKTWYKKLRYAVKETQNRVSLGFSKLTMSSKIIIITTMPICLIWWIFCIVIGIRNNYKHATKLREHNRPAYLMEVL